MLRIAEEAFDDLNQGFLFYETQSAGLGSQRAMRELELIGVRLHCATAVDKTSGL